MRIQNKVTKELKCKNELTKKILEKFRLGLDLSLLECGLVLTLESK